MSKIPAPISLAHTKAVKKLYKGALRNIESWHSHRHYIRYLYTLMRKRFDDNKCFKDPTVAQELVKSGEHELREFMCYAPRKFMNSPGGTAWNREVQPPDWVLDYWHPLEKAQYPEYFARREERKKEFVKIWTKQYMPSSDDDDKTKIKE